MDLGSLELQIFVSLTVVLGGAFVALVCDYLKGNNEQLREHNIELRVRKEEQERRMILDPAGFASQFAPQQAAIPDSAVTAARTIAVHEVMQSFATDEALADAKERAAALHARVDDEAYNAAEIPPVTQRRRGWKSTRRRAARSRNARRSANPYPDWVRPETIERVARDAEAAAAPGGLPVQDEPASLNAEAEPADAPELHKEIERVAQLQQLPVAPAPRTILRPLTVPALKLEEEIQRIAIATPVPAPPLSAPWHSPLLEEVIAASATRPLLVNAEQVPEFEIVSEVVEETAAWEARETVAAEEAAPAVAVVALAAEVDEPTAAPVETEPRLFEFAELAVPADAAEVEPPPFVAMPVELAAVHETAAEEIALAMEPPPFGFEPQPDVDLDLELTTASEIISYYDFQPRSSPLAGLGGAAQTDYLACEPSLKTPVARIPLSEEPALARAAEPAFEPLPELAPVDLEPPPFWAESAAIAIVPEPIDISEARHAEPEPDDLPLPPGMHDLPTWTCLVTHSHLLDGIVIVIALQSNTEAAVEEENIPGIDRLMTSFLREGEFGSRISATEWIFVYSHDAAGFNQRRVGMISEKLWDFQLRHLGMANVTFKWGAVDVKGEPLTAALNAARDRMNQGRKASRLHGADTRRAVNA
ncbi:MAG: hypothetical protein HYX27_14615 [Acidobacteria bacterium]|nr:hypothetical protein [Acidobacteriota bacterium]